jgi:glutathione S-transferase
MHEAKIEFEARTITNPTYREELLQKGGNLQVPFFVDTDNDVAMYESDDIIQYLKER